MRTTLLTFCFLLSLAVSVQAREPMQDPDDLVVVELATVAVDPFTGLPVVLLREADTGDVVPISIGPEEALAIIRALESVLTPRPMTHDMTVEVIMAMGGSLKRIMVDGLVENSYHGVLDIRLDDDPETPVYVDTRPSDALALAVRTDAGILVAPDVLQASRGEDFEGFSDNQVVTALGITVGMVDNEVREAMELPDAEGLLVLRAVGEAQEKGIGAGALILEVNGETPADPLAFLEHLQPGSSDLAIIRYWYDDDISEVELDTTRPAPDPNHSEPTGPSSEKLVPAQRGPRV